MADPTPPPGSLRSAVPGRIRSLPNPTRASTRLAGMEALSYEGDMNWRRGIGVLWTLFALIAVAEACRLAFYLLIGYTFWPTPFDMIRLSGMCAVFVALWFGLDWTRWVLAVAGFFYGAGCIIQVLMANDLALRAGMLPSQRLPGESLVNAPMLAAGVLYLILGGYLAFSADVVGFTKHRREEGRLWVVVPVVLLLNTYLAVMLSGQIIYRLWLRGMRHGAADFGQESLHAIAEHWDLPALDARCSEELLDRWLAVDRKNLLAAHALLGPLRGHGAETADVRSFFDSQEDGFAFGGSYHTAAQFAHGQAEVDFVLTRGFFTPWQIRVIALNHPRFEAPPTPLPAATPAASPVPPTGG